MIAGGPARLLRRGGEAAVPLRRVPGVRRPRALRRDGRADLPVARGEDGSLRSLCGLVKAPPTHESSFFTRRSPSYQYPLKNSQKKMIQSSIKLSSSHLFSTYPAILLNFVMFQSIISITRIK